jgi:hypothetical protein
MAGLSVQGSAAPRQTEVRRRIILPSRGTPCGGSPSRLRRDSRRCDVFRGTISWTKNSPISRSQFSNG